MKLKLKSRPITEYLMWIIVLISIFAQGFISFFDLANTIKYAIDLLLLVSTVLLITNKLRLNKPSKSIIAFISLFFIYALITYFINYEDILYLLWGTRNNFRFYLFFILCLIKFNSDDVSTFEKLFDVLYWINILFVTVEFIMGYSGDNIGGIFGVSRGCNGYINIFLIITVTRSILRYINKKVDFAYLFFVIATTVYIGALAELKFLFVEMVIIIALAILITNFTYRKLFLVFVGIIAIVLGVFLLVTIFPNWADFFTLEKMMEIGSTEEGYTGQGDINRLTAIQTISDKFLTTSYDKLFGIGLGNADFSSTVEAVTTEFYQKYRLLHYNWISVAFIYLEMGTIGLIFFEGFFIFLIFQYRKLRKSHPEFKMETELAIIIAVMCLVLTIYNSALRSEAGYMMYLFLALPFCKLNKTKSNNVESERKLSVHF